MDAQRLRIRVGARWDPTVALIRVLHIHTAAAIAGHLTVAAPMGVRRAVLVADDLQLIPAGSVAQGPAVGSVVADPAAASVAADPTAAEDTLHRAASAAAAVTSVEVAAVTSAEVAAGTSVAVVDTPVAEATADADKSQVVALRPENSPA